MEENASQALMMAFAIFIFVMALSLAMFLFSKVSSTSETLALYADATLFYDNVAVVGREGIERYVILKPLFQLYIDIIKKISVLKFMMLQDYMFKILQKKIQV